ncbi:14224_t:CDS:2 [Entrophospora sp. SA101]|nr:14224_t:CDS:2 [Entrophospora sp. SA101]
MDPRTPQTGIYPQQYSNADDQNNAHLQAYSSNSNPMMSIAETRSVYPVPVESPRSITGNDMPAAKRFALAPTTTQSIQNIYPNLIQNQSQLAPDQLYGGSSSIFPNPLINTVRTISTLPTRTNLSTDGSNHYNLINNSHPAAQQINQTIHNSIHPFNNQMDWLELTNDEDIDYDFNYNTDSTTPSSNSVEGSIPDWTQSTLLQKNINYPNQNPSSKSLYPLITKIRSRSRIRLTNSSFYITNIDDSKYTNSSILSVPSNNTVNLISDSDDNNSGGSSSIAQDLSLKNIQSSVQASSSSIGDNNGSSISSNQYINSSNSSGFLVNVNSKQPLNDINQQQQQHNDDLNQQSAAIIPTNLLNISQLPPILHLPTNQGIACKINCQVNEQSEKNPSVSNNILPTLLVLSQSPNQSSSLPTTNPINTKTIKPPRLIYAPKTRRVDSYGGLNLTVFERLPLPLVIPRIQDLGVVDIHALTMSLKSGMKLEVTNALNTLTIISSYKNALLDLNRCDELVDVLIDIIMEYLDCVSINYYCYSNESKGENSLPNNKFLTYLELFQQSKRECEEFSDVELEQFSISEGWLQLHEQYLHNKKRYARKKAYDILEYRKIVLIILSNIAGYVSMPSILAARDLLLIISDFLNNSDDYYAQIALEVLSKLTVSYENRQKVSECDEDTLKSIFEKLVRLLPKVESDIYSRYNYNGNIITHTSSFQELPFLATLIMSFFNFASLNNETMKKRIIATSGFINRMLKMTLILASIRNIRTGANEEDCVMLARRSMEMLKVLAKGNKESFLLYNEQLLNALLIPYIDPVVVKDLETIVIYPEALNNNDDKIFNAKKKLSNLLVFLWIRCLWHEEVDLMTDHFKEHDDEGFNAIIIHDKTHQGGYYHQTNSNQHPIHIIPPNETGRYTEQNKIF